MKRSRFVDRVLHNADIRTQDDRLPRATAVAIGEGRILAVGQDHEILPLQNPDTSVEDMEGRLILPGFMDSHFHFDQWAIGLQLPDLSRARDFDQAMSLVAAQAERTVPGGWVVGLGFNEGDWKNRRIPDRHDLDRITPYHPVLVWRCDLHLAVANTRALELAGVT
ncbi:MAG: amidohydrolase, partial [Deltaproteobacteria bacterium]|nr:amidohydrolase [Deltaproteobacteria bacterium]